MTDAPRPDRPAEKFKADHAPGTREKPAPLTASRWPAVLSIPAELRTGWPAFLPSRLSLALHMTGRVPFEASDKPHLRRGRYMERFGEDELHERGWQIHGTQIRWTHARMNALTYLDVLATGPDDDRQQIVEFKTVDERDYRVAWAEGPPLYPVLQVQCQMAITNHVRAQVGAIVRRYKGDELILHEVKRDEPTIEILERRGQEFLDLIREREPEKLAELLVEDASPDSYQAWSRVAQLAKEPRTPFLEPTAVSRALRWHQARLDRLAASAIEEAEKNWFAVYAPPAEILELADGTRINRTVVAPSRVPAHTRSRHVKWDVKPGAGEESADG